MNNESKQRPFDVRNLMLAIGGVAAIIIFLAIVLRSHDLKHRQQVDSEQTTAESVIHQDLTETPIVNKTKVNIQPMVTKFPPLPDFSSIEQSNQRKAAFIDYLTPIIKYQNEKILKERARLEYISMLIFKGYELPDHEREWLQNLADKYEVEWSAETLNAIVPKLSKRVDIIPLSLAVVQAAKESSWGRSRYAVMGNNLFGQWCYNQGCGFIPIERNLGAKHEVRKFKTVNEAARSYIHNLNTHPRYESLRKIRHELRLQNKEITGRDLANGLLFYSERRRAYVDEVKVMIEQYQVFQERRTG